MNTYSRSRKLEAGGVSKVMGGPTKKQRRSLDSPSGAGSSRDTGKAVTELNIQGMALFSKGEFDGAHALFRKAITIRSPALGRSQVGPSSKDNDVNDTSNGSCVTNTPPPSSYIYQRMDFDEGLTVYSEPLPVQADDLPEAIEATLLFNAGQARKKLNDLDGACSFYKQALQIFLPSNRSAIPQNLALIKSEHDVIVPLLHAVGQLAYRKGKLEDGLCIYDTALQLCNQFHGKHSVAKARTLNCLAVLLYHGSIENSERAKQCFEEALEIQAEVLVLGEGSSFEKATTLNNLGRVHVQREDFQTALDLYEKALEIRLKLGEDHIDYAATAFNAGQSLHQLGEFDRALTLYQTFLRVAEKKFTRNHRDVAVVLSGIAQIYQEMRNYEKAVSLYEESLVVGRAALGNSHSEVAMLLNRLGNYHFDRGNFAKALTAYEEGLLIEQRVLEETHPNVIVTLTNIGEIYRQKNDFQNAIRLYLEAVRLQKKCYGSSSVEVASTLNVLGLIYDLQGNSTMALSCLQEALVIRRSTLGDNHLDVSATLTYLATIFYKRGATCMALQLFSESLRIRVKLHGKNHRDVSFALYNVGLCHFNIGCYEEAIVSYKETLRIERAVFGESHRDVALTLFKLGEVYLANRNFTDALGCFQEALEVERETGNEADPKTVARILNEIGNVHLADRNLRLMMDAFVEAARVLEAVGLFQHDTLTLPDQLYAFAAACPSSASAA